MNRSPAHIAAIFSLIAAANFAVAQDVTRLGGDLTTDLTGHNAIQVFAPNVTDPGRKETQLAGFDDFHDRVAPEEGMGPRFVNASCGGCHAQNGRGHLRFAGTVLSGGGSAVVKIAERKADPEIELPAGVLQNHSISGRRFHHLNLKWKAIRGKYPDGTSFTLRRPTVSYRVSGINPRKLVHSLRMSPAIIGPGLLEAITESSLLALADPADSNGDGISGKANYVLDRRTGGTVPGRFGFKAGQPTTEQQTTAALFNEMGITNELFPDPDGAPAEFSSEALNRLVIYQIIAGVPKARIQDDPAVQQGKELFKQIGCDDCHTMTFTTGSHSSPELVGQEIHPFTDLLLHDMGPGLADKLTESLARGSEWRTTPLWGLGFSETLSDVVPLYLHDGRARSVEEAILWHGGEAKQVTQNFKGLTKAEREALISFLRSL